MKQYLEPILAKALAELGVEGESNIVFEIPRNPEHGNLSTNVAMTLAGRLKKNPRQVAQDIIDKLAVDRSVVTNIAIAGPGFINFTFSDDFYARRIAELAALGDKAGRSDEGRGVKVNIEYVSANPTGGLHLGHGRNAVLGHVLATLLEWRGYDVTREYYFNNAGNQMAMLGESIYARYRQELGEAKYPFPENGYHGDYIREIAREIVRSYGNALVEKNDMNMDTFRRCGEEWCFGLIRQTLVRIGATFDSYFNEDSLYRDKKVHLVLSMLREKGLVYEKDGAVWLAYTKLGMEQDRVVVKSTGEATYRLPDIAYHITKYQRGFDWIIDIFGADHIATIPDVTAAVKALGFDADKITPVIYQFVTLSEGGEQVKMSKRSSKNYTLDDLLNMLGKDVVRYFFIMRGNSTHLEFDLDLARDQTEKNPVIYLQYAHARVASVQRKARERGIETVDTPDWTRLRDEHELELMQILLRFDDTLKRSLSIMEPVVITEYLRDLAASFHRFYHNCHILVEDADLCQARIHLSLLTQRILRNGLTILGISAPEEM